jgi:hypothetical protein
MHFQISDDYLDRKGPCGIEGNAKACPLFQVRGCPSNRCNCSYTKCDLTVFESTGVLRRKRAFAGQDHFLAAYQTLCMSVGNLNGDQREKSEDPVPSAYARH